MRGGSRHFVGKFWVKFRIAGGRRHILRLRLTMVFSSEGKIQRGNKG